MNIIYLKQKSKWVLSLQLDFLSNSLVEYIYNHYFETKVSSLNGFHVCSWISCPTLQWNTFTIRSNMPERLTRCTFDCMPTRRRKKLSFSEWIQDPLVILVFSSVRPSVRLSIHLSVYMHSCLSVCIAIYLSICLSLYLSVYLSLYLSICPSIYLSICLHIYVSICLSVFISIYLSICPSIYLSICLYIYVSISLSAHLSISLSVLISIYLSICLSIYLSFCRLVYLSVCLCCRNIFVSVGKSFCPSLSTDVCLSVFFQAFAMWWFFLFLINNIWSFLCNFRYGSNRGSFRTGRPLSRLPKNFRKSRKTESGTSETSHRRLPVSPERTERRTVLVVFPEGLPDAGKLCQTLHRLQSLPSSNCFEIFVWVCHDILFREVKDIYLVVRWKLVQTPSNLKSYFPIFRSSCQKAVKMWPLRNWIFSFAQKCFKFAIQRLPRCSFNKNWTILLSN